MREFYNIIIEHPFVTIFLVFAILAILDSLGECISKIIRG